MKKIYLAVLISFISNLIFCQQFDFNNSVQLQVNVSSATPSVQLHWTLSPEADSFFVYKRNINETSWGVPITTLYALDTTYTDSDVAVGEAYEYRVLRLSSAGTGNGYIYAGIEIPIIENRGTMILVIDSTHQVALSAEIELYVQNCQMDGWKVEQIVVSPNDEVVDVKSQIKNIYDTDPTSVNTVFLLGHIPVPYAGNIGPDGHNNHIGAWPADVFYADMDGAWSDNFVNNTTAAQSRNHNIPGDGKYDNSVIASDVELSIGRVDFHSLPAFAESEEELLRKYLLKNHAFKTKAFDPIRRGLIENNFGGFAEGFGQNGLKNFTTMFGADSVYYRDYNTLKTDSYMWSYGCGGGNYTGAGGISNTNNFSMDSIQSVFTMLFGSYFGDWDSNNNFLRAALGTGTILSNAWAGRPNWQFHPMSLGWTIGYCTRLSQNNSGASYSAGFGNRSIHVALMGDPTLRMHMVRQPENLTAMEENGQVHLNWASANDEEIGYYIYRKVEGEYERLNDWPISDLSYVDSCLEIGSYTYMLKTVKLEESASGTYYNLSLGVEANVDVITDIQVVASFNIDDNNTGLIQLENTSQNAATYLWDFGNGVTSMETNPSIELEENNYLITLIASNECTSDTISQEITVTSDLVLQKELELTIHPNPVQETLFVNCKNCSKQSFNIIDAIGKQVLEVSGFSSQESIDLSGLPSGVYQLQWLSKGGLVKTKKFIKQ